jgi:hypothetical protein
MMDILLPLPQLKLQQVESLLGIGEKHPEMVNFVND